MTTRSILIMFCAACFLLLFFACKKSNSSSNNTTVTSSNATVSTLAGTGKAGTANGTGAMATFNEPSGVCTDNDENILVADYSNGEIRKIASLTGLVSVLAGDVLNSQSCDDGLGGGAGFTFPEGICSNSNGDVYVADQSCGIRQIGNSGAVSTLFKNDLDKPFTDHPSFACADNEGNVYSISLDNGVDDYIYKVDKQGNITIFAGSGVNGYKDGDATSAQFSYLQGICIDNNNNIFVADGSRIRKITGGQVTTVAGTISGGYLDGPAASAQFGGLAGICTDNKGNIYVTDGGYIRKISAQGIVSTVAGNPGLGFKDGDAATAQFNTPRGICVDAQGNLVVADFGNNRVRKITFK